MGSPLPLQGANPYTGMYQARQFGVGNLSPTPNYVADYLETPPSAMVTAQAQTPLVEQAEFWGLQNQTITINGAPTGGTFVLQYDIDFTSPIPYNATANAIQGALAAIGSVGGVNEVQSVTVTGVPTGGTFTLTYAGQTTAAIAYNAPATGTNSVQAALAALSNIISVANVGVTGSAGGPYTVTFKGSLGGQNIAQMTASGTSLTGGTTPGVTVATVTAGVNNLAVTGSAGGPYTVVFGTPFANKPVQLIRVRSTALTGGTKPSVVVTSSAQQQGISPF